MLLEFVQSSRFKVVSKLNLVSFAYFFIDLQSFVVVKTMFLVATKNLT